MKSSYFTTPRTLGECAFIPSCDPFEYHRRPKNIRRGLLWLALVLAVFATSAYFGR